MYTERGLSVIDNSKFLMYNSILLIWLSIAVVGLVTFWVLFNKAGRPGWESLIPIYNTVVMLKIAGKPVWWFFLLLIPIVNLVISVLVVIGFLKAFGKTGAGSVILSLLFPLIYYAYLAFSKDVKYIGV